MPTPKVAKHFNILSLDGGGVQGTFEAIVIARLLKTYPKLLRETDLISGVSTGGLQALGLAAGMPPPELASFYTDAAKFIFADARFRNVKDPWKISGARYDNKNLKNLLRVQFGDMRLGELEKKVAIVTFDLDNEAKDPTLRTWKLKVFHNFQGPDSDSEEQVVDVALKTSAAPTYFPTYGGFADGGLVVNNPSLIGLAQALDGRAGGRALPEIALLSLGTGRASRFVKGKDLNWGVTQWAPHLPQILLEADVDATHFQCKTILGEKYFRINAALEEAFSLDAWEKVPKLAKLANEYKIDPAIGWLEKNWV